MYDGRCSVCCVMSYAKLKTSIAMPLMTLSRLGGGTRRGLFASESPSLSLFLSLSLPLSFTLFLSLSLFLLSLSLSLSLSLFLSISLSLSLSLSFSLFLSLFLSLSLSFSLSLSLFLSLSLALSLCRSLPLSLSFLPAPPPPPPLPHSLVVLPVSVNCLAPQAFQSCSFAELQDSLWRCTRSTVNRATSRSKDTAMKVCPCLFCAFFLLDMTSLKPTELTAFPYTSHLIVGIVEGQSGFLQT